jgi:beta-lactam-binding protein with PASTA domain
MIKDSIWSIILKVLLLFIFLTISVTSIIIFIILYPSPKDVVKVPNLIGKDRISAIGILSKKRLGIKEIYRPHDTLPKNYVIAQDPPPGTEVKAKRKIEVVLSSGRMMVVVPNFCELPISEVKENLCRINSENYCGVQVKYISYTHSATIPPNYVISQTPTPGTKVPKNTGISLIVSCGPKETNFYMPDLIGMHIKEAKKILEDMELYAEIKEEIHEHMEEDIVISQSPLPGHKITKGGTVAITISAYLVGDNNSVEKMKKY